MFGIKIKFEKTRKNADKDAPARIATQSVAGGEKRGTGDVKEKKVFVSDIAPSAPTPRIGDIFSDEPEKKSWPKKIEEESADDVGGKPFGAAPASGEVGWVWEFIAKIALYALIFLTPLFFLPWGVAVVATNKQFLAVVLVIIAFIAWLAKTIASGKLAWPKTLLNVAMWLVVLAWGVSAFFSVAKMKSLGFASLEPDTLLNMLTYILAFFLFSAVFGNRQRVSLRAPQERSEAISTDGNENMGLPRSSRFAGLASNNGIEKAIYVFLGSLAILAVFIGLKFLNVNLLPSAWDFAKTIDFNPIGTINALGLFLGFGLVMVVGLLVCGSCSSLRGVRQLADDKAIPGDSDKIMRLPRAFSARNDKFIKTGLILLALIICAELLLKNFSGIWWAMAISMLFLVAYVFTRETQNVKQGKSDVIKTQKLVLPIVILAISVILILVKLPIANLIAFPAEVSPSNSATYEIAKDAWKAKGGSAEIGSGPATFGYNYGLYRSQVINQTVFWGVKFAQGSSFILTSLSSVGIFGFLALLLLIAAFIWQALKMFSSKKENNEEENGDFRVPIIAASLFALLVWFLYPANFTLMLFGFIMMGLLLATNAGSAENKKQFVIARSQVGLGDEAISEKNDNSMREISLLASPQRTLIVSLILIILMVGSVSILYLNGQKYIASLYFSSGMKIFDKTADPDLALEKFVKAINLDSAADQYWRVASQAFLVKTNNILNSPKWQGAPAAALEDLRSQFQLNMSQSISFAQRAKDADVSESLNWSNLGYVYENILSFVTGAEKFMVDSYSQALSLEPKNPALAVDLGRAHIAAADRLAGQVNQMASEKNPDKSQIDAWTSERNAELDAAIRELQRAIDLKADYSPAHFLLVQVYNRQGDLKKALVKSIDYYNLNPKDAGAAFQLGFLYYKDNQMENAKVALEWAVSLSENYSNARYFLGLIYDAQGNKQAAKEQFQKIAALNADNEEVKKILDNLNNGRGALETIVPPLPAPENRTQTPVPETGGAPQQPLAP